MHFYSVTIKHE